MRGISNESTNDAENDENVVLKAKPYHVDELVLHSKKCYKCDAVNQVTARSLSHSCQNCSAVNCFQCKKIHLSVCDDEAVVEQLEQASTSAIEELLAKPSTQEPDVVEGNVSKLQSGDKSAEPESRSRSSSVELPHEDEDEALKSSDEEANIQQPDVNSNIPTPKRAAKRSYSDSETSVEGAMSSSGDSPEDLPSEVFKEDQVPNKRVKLDALFYGTDDGNNVCQLCLYENSKFTSFLNHLKTLKHKQNMAKFKDDKKFAD